MPANFRFRKLYQRFSFLFLILVAVMLLRGLIVGASMLDTSSIIGDWKFFVYGGYNTCSIEFFQYDNEHRKKTLNRWQLFGLSSEKSMPSNVKVVNSRVQADYQIKKVCERNSNLKKVFVNLDCMNNYRWDPVYDHYEICI